MLAYIQTDKQGEFFNVNAFVAYKGFEFLGWEIKKYYRAEDVSDLNPEHLFVGGVGNMRKRLEMLGILTTEELDYPLELHKYLGRAVWESTLEALIQTPEKWNVFVKPKELTKQFTGKMIREHKDFIGLGSSDFETPIWCSEPVNFIAEWRCFIRYGQILDIRHYRGAWDAKLDLSVIQNAVSDFSSAPAAYSLDFGVDEKGAMKLVEVNDGYSLGSYGIAHYDYAKFLLARWSELTGTVDYLK
jgi:hypothetical protein